MEEDIHIFSYDAHVSPGKEAGLLFRREMEEQGGQVCYPAGVRAGSCP